jgi:murein DD-endopeptidase MepM/ murein hydrolase activator NlpD
MPANELSSFSSDDAVEVSYTAIRATPPVTGLVTSAFDMRRHPITGNYSMHDGIDIAAEEGREILSALPGRVEEVGVSDIYGNYIKIRHNADMQTMYCHCSKILAHEGAIVAQGDTIALVGSTGLTTGAHLHFAVIESDGYANPFELLRANVVPIDN